MFHYLWLLAGNAVAEGLPSASNSGACDKGGEDDAAPVYAPAQIHQGPLEAAPANILANLQMQVFSASIPAETYREADPPVQAEPLQAIACQPASAEPSASPSVPKRRSRQLSQKVKEILAEKGITYGNWQKTHRDKSSVPKAWVCSVDGFVKFQGLLRAGTEPRCDGCLAVLEMAGTSAAHVSSSVRRYEAMLDQPPGGSRPSSRMSDSDDEDVQESPEKRRCLPDVDVIGMASANPFLEVLQPGSLNRKLPVKCLLCLGQKIKD